MICMMLFVFVHLLSTRFHIIAITIYQMAMGAAAVVGSIIGSIVGGKLHIMC